MSPTARIMLGISVLLIAIGFFGIAVFVKDFAPEAILPMSILGSFCALIALACLSVGSQPITIRIIGGAVFLISVLYVGDQLRSASSVKEEFDKAKQKGRPSVAGSLTFFVLVGLPSGYAALTGKYPGWGAHSGAFDDGKPRKKKRRR
jgi:hypothetical protein